VLDEIARTDEWKNATLWYMRLAVLEARMTWDAAHDGDFLNALGAAPSLAEASGFLDWGILGPRLNRLIPAAAPGGLGPGSGMLRLALMAASANQGVAEGDPVRTFLASLLDANNHFSAALGVDGLLSGVSDAGTIAERVRPTAPPAGGDGGGGGGGGEYHPPANIDIDGKPGADVYVRSTTRHAITTPYVLNVRRGPGMKYPPFGWAKKGERVYVIGESGKWTAVEYGDRTGFVYTPLIQGQATDEALDADGP
jgi:Bacterial SH3 domain